ncbi:nuclear transport factor 2 family protein [Edaphobacillus lindanitolerans]|uniref:DUF4440 domain-containing protein n=1 Tax=Edaphobacillus lindanitolerans TaxID=550447 RepID=A0A1U7PLM6_9BACI|nr:nuclear transport factor 2 family protein [Edaphobacillus lindanitolerans]SIT69159.1 hypothetical protein SAMN05428946_0454 [Edaphobacillus lindanitolerans]
MKTKSGLFIPVLLAALFLGACGGKTDENQNMAEDGTAPSGENSAVGHGVEDGADQEADDPEVGFGMTDGTIEEAENVPEEEKAAILDTFAQYMETFNNQDPDGYTSLLVEGKDGFDIDEEKKAMQELFAAYDVERSAENETIVSYKDGEAQLFSNLTTTMTSKASKEARSEKGRQVTVFKKAGDAWKVKEIYYIGDSA